MDMISVENEALYGTGIFSGVYSKNKILGWFFASKKIDEEDENLNILTEVACNCKLPSRKVIKRIAVPKKYDSILVHCKYCNQPLAGFSGFITNDWKLEINKDLL